MISNGLRNYYRTQQSSQNKGSRRSQQGTSRQRTQLFYTYEVTYIQGSRNIYYSFYLRRSGWTQRGQNNLAISRVIELYIESTNNQTIMNENIERLHTRINLIREESRTISYRIEALEERRKELQEQKKHLKEILSNMSQELGLLLTIIYQPSPFYLFSGGGFFYL